MKSAEEFKLPRTVRKRINGYIIETECYKNKDENGKWVYSYDDLEIKKTHWYSTDPNDPVTAKLYSQYPYLKPKDTSGLSRRAAIRKSNGGRLGWIERSPDGVMITNFDIEFPLTSNKVKEMYEDKRVKFYLRFNVGYNKGNYRKTNFILYKKLLAASYKLIRIARRG